MYAADVDLTENMMLIDNGGRRLGNDRRFFHYNGYLPERRVMKDRRIDMDRRKKPRLA